MLACCLLKTGRLRINDATRKGHIAQGPLRRPTLLENAPGGHMPLYISQGILKPSRPRVLVTKGSIGSTDSTSWSKGCVDIMVVAGGIKTSWSKGCVDIMVVAGGINLYV